MNNIGRHIAPLLMLISLMSSAPALSLEKVTLQLKWVHAFQFAGYYAAKEKGFFRDAGLDVEILEATPNTQVPKKVISGEAEYGVGTSSLLLERHSGKPVVVLAVIFQHSPLALIARQEDDNQVVQNLAGKRVMLEPQSEEIIAYLKLEGVPIDRINLIEHRFDYQDLVSGNTDAISAYTTNETYFLDQAGLPYLTFTPRSAGIDFYGDNLFTSEQEIKMHPKRVEAFREASLKGWQYAMANPDEIIELILKKYRTNYSREFLRFEADSMVSLVQPKLVEMGYMHTGRWSHIANVYAGLNMLPEGFPLQDFLYLEQTQSYRWLYQTLAIAGLAIMMILVVSLYIYRTNRKLDKALSESQQAQEMIWNQANLDPLTSLPNRRMFRDRLIQEMKKSDRTDKPFALMYLDLDHFKAVNDAHGHDRGDRLLLDVARRLKGCVREVDTIARLGGDEFTIIMGELENTQSVERVANSILETLAKPFNLDLESAYISTSIGITLYPNDATQVDSLLKNADQAMYAAKDAGRNCFHFFTEEMQRNAQHRVRLINDLRNALEQDQLELLYQPIVDLKSGAITKMEALLRWNHPERGSVNPSEFIPIAEETGKIVDIGDWVFRKATEQLSQWRREFGLDLSISINTSPAQYQRRGNNMTDWLNHLRQIDVPFNNVIVEITEGMLMGSFNEISDKLLTFRDAGIQVALDDFGTGYSSLSYLKKFDIDFIKIDKSFVSNLQQDSNDLVLCQAIVIMSHKLGLMVVAEGIENDDQRLLLRNAGCDFAQGYLFSKPVSAEIIFEMLQRQLSRVIN